MIRLVFQITKEIEQYEDVRSENRKHFTVIERVSNAEGWSHLACRVMFLPIVQFEKVV